MPNQPKPGTSRHEISAIPDDLWARAQVVAVERGESVSAVVRRALQDYTQGEGTLPPPKMLPVYSPQHGDHH